MSDWADEEADRLVPLGYRLSRVAVATALRAAKREGLEMAKAVAKRHQQIEHDAMPDDMCDGPETAFNIAKSIQSLIDLDIKDQKKKEESV